LSTSEVRKDRTMQRKYLITWSLTLGSQELARISNQPDTTNISKALDKALNYARSLAKDNELELYRFVTMDELTRHTRPTTLQGAKISGIAITKASSVEAAGEMIKSWVTGLTYGGISIGEYLEYEIKPLAAMGQKGWEQ
jgi:hypothetical protein